MRSTTSRYLATMFLFIMAAAVAFTAQAEPKKAVKVTDKDAGGKITIQEQGELVVELPGHNSNGRVWTLAKHDPKQLELVGKKQPDVVPGPKEKGIDQTLYAVFRFKALKSGDLELHYAVPSLTEKKPDKEFKLRVEVAPPK